MKPVSKLTKQALIKNVRDLREGVDVPYVLHPRITASELTLRYRALVAELRRKLSGASQSQRLTG